MADKKRFDQNQRWLTNIRREIAAMQEFALGCSVLCTRESPDVNWAELVKRTKAVAASIEYGSQNDKR